MNKRIHGVGTDILELERISRVIGRRGGERFLQRILTEKERALYREKQRSGIAFAGGRFAAKEAVVKALGTGIGSMIGFADMEILPNAMGKPECTLSSAAEQRLQLPAYTIHLSISHSRAYAAATAVVEVTDA